MDALSGSATSKIDNVATHPLTRDYAQRTAEFFDLHRRPEICSDILTFVDEDGERRSMMWFLHRSKEAAGPQAPLSRIHHEALRGGVDAAHARRRRTTSGDLYRRSRAVGEGVDRRGRPRARRQYPQFLAIRDGQRSGRAPRISSIRRPTAPIRTRTPPRRRCASCRPMTKASWSTASRRSALPRPSAISCISASSSVPGQGRPDHLRRLPGQPERHHHRLPRKRREGRPGRASARLAGRRARCHGAVRQCADPLEIRVPYRQSGPRQALSAAGVRLGPLLRAGAPGGPRRTDGRPCDPDVRASRHGEDRGGAGAPGARSSDSQQSVAAHVIASEDQGFYTPGGSTSPTSSCSTGAASTSWSISAPWCDELIDLCGRSRDHVPDREAVAGSADAALVREAQQGRRSASHTAASRSRASSAIFISPTGAAGSSCSRISTARRCRPCFR